MTDLPFFKEILFVYKKTKKRLYVVEQSRNNQTRKFIRSCLKPPLISGTYVNLYILGFSIIARVDRSQFFLPSCAIKD